MFYQKRKTCTNGKHMGHYKAVMKHGWLSWLFIQKGEIPVILGHLLGIKMCQFNDYEK